jgi:glycosyltransferase involved in cell wall biosynthesis
VIAVSWPGVKDLIDDGLSGRVIDGDPRVLATSINCLINDREASRRLGDAARQAAEQRRMMPVGTRYAQFLERILAEKGLVSDGGNLNRVESRGGFGDA